MTTDKKNRPAGEPDGLQKSPLGGSSSLAPFSPEMAAIRAHGVLMVLVHNPENGRYRRRIVLSLSAASKAVERAEARGHVAHIVLGRFQVVEVVS